MPGDSAPKLAIIWTPPGRAEQEHEDKIPMIVVLLVNCGDFAVRSLPQVVIGSPSLGFHSGLVFGLEIVHSRMIRAMYTGRN